MIFNLYKQEVHIYNCFIKPYATKNIFFVLLKSPSWAISKQGYSQKKHNSTLEL